MPARPRKGARFGGSAAHQKAMMANLVAGLIAAESITTTEAKAKAMRPIAEKMITKAKKGGVHNHRNVVKFLRDREMASKLFDEIGPRYADEERSVAIEGAGHLGLLISARTFRAVLAGLRTPLPEPA